MRQVFGPDDLTPEDYADWGRLESQEINSPTEYADLLADYAQNGAQASGPCLPWNKTHEHIRFNPGQLSIWAGENGSGKSVLVGQVMLNFMRQKQNALVASLEMLPVETLYRMAKQHVGCSPSSSAASQFCHDHEGSLWIYDQQDSVEWHRILGLVHYAANELRVDHLVLDSLTKCGLTRDDYAQQAKFIDRLQWAAKNHQIHIHLVCHMRKGQEGHKSGKWDIRGAAEISDLADSVFVLSRNYQKEQEAAKQKAGRPVNDESVLEKHDAYLSLVKNRHYGTLKNWGLNFEDRSLRYVDGEPRASGLS